MIKKLQALKAKKGFTLVELVVVIAIIGVLAAILIPTLMNVVTKARVSGANQTAKYILDTVHEFLTDADSNGYGQKRDNSSIAAFELKPAANKWEVTVDDKTAFTETSRATASWKGTSGLPAATEVLGKLLSNRFPKTSSGYGVAYAQGGVGCAAVVFSEEATSASSEWPKLTSSKAWPATTSWKGDAGVDQTGCIVGTSPIVGISTT